MSLIGLFIFHFLADWVLQSVEMGRQKSNKFDVLLKHVGIHFIVFFLGGLLFFSPLLSLGVAFVNAVVHGVIDWYIWRGYKLSVFYRRHKLIPAEKYEEWGTKPQELSLKDYKDMIQNKDFTEDTEEMTYLKTEFKFWEDHWFSMTLGFDQLLHALTIAAIYLLMVV